MFEVTHIYTALYINRRVILLRSKKEMLPVVKHKNILKIAMLSQKSIVNTYLSLTLSLIVLNKKLTIEALEVNTTVQSHHFACSPQESKKNYHLSTGRYNLLAYSI